jgi:hypothetical protein
MAGHLRRFKKIIMKKSFFGLILIAALGACNNSSDAELKDPSTVQPPSEAIPDSTRLVNDSVIVPDTTSGNGRQVGKSDSIQRNRQ